MKVEELNATHPDYDADALARWDALYRGGRAFRARLEDFLPQNAVEPADVYADRKRIAGLYTNEVGPICDRTLAHLFSEPPALGAAQGWWATFQDSVDRQGTDWAAFWRDRMLQALISGRSYAWVNLPARPDGTQVETLADQERAGLLDAYLVPLDASEVIDWGEDETGGLSWVRVHQVLALAPGPVGGRRRVHRWIAIDAEEIRTWEVELRADQRAPDPGQAATERPPVRHGFGRLPVVALVLPEGLHVGAKLHDPAVDLFRARAALTWALYRTAHAMMVLKRKWAGDAPVLGPGYYLQLEPGDEVSWTEPPGNANAALAQDVRDKRDALYRVVDQMAASVDSTATQQARSGESKSQDWASHAKILAAYAALVHDAMRATVDLVAIARGDTRPPQVGALEGWKQQPTTTVLLEATQALALGVPSPTFERAVHKRIARRLLPDAPAAMLEEIEREIDEADLGAAPFAVSPPR